jgi:signal transduction histidine kinase
VSRELHDDICQRLSALRLRLNLLEEGDDGSGQVAQSELAPLKDQIDHIIADVRRISADLRPSALDLFGIGSALRGLTEQVRALFPSSRVLFTETGELPAEIDKDVGTALYRIAQEALNNATKHASATVISVILSSENGTVGLSVQDNGVGFIPCARAEIRPGHHGYGLRSMRERAELLGGTFALHSAPREGTLLEVRIPLERP